MKRRKFLKEIGQGSALTMLPFATLPVNFSNNTLTFGIVADVHKDLTPDADQRLEKFIDEAKKRKVNFILQLGDFCMAYKKNKDFLSAWESFNGPKYHVLGNHDMDGHTKSQMLDFWEMPATYYSFDQKGIHFIVLDANFIFQDGKYIDYANANFYIDDGLRTYIDEKQIEWLKAELDSVKSPTIVLSHQSLWHYQHGVKNRLIIQKILEQHSNKIICCMNGHNHIDFHHLQNGINYIELNSMSYQWMSDKYRNSSRYPAELYAQYKWLPNLATYKDPLYAFATVDLKGSMKIEGVRSSWVSPSPYDLGMPMGLYGNVATPEISDYQLRFQ